MGEEACVDRLGETRFPLSAAELTQVREIIKLVRDHLRDMEPALVRSAACVLLALQRLPVPTTGIDLTFGFTQRNTDGNYGWADLMISDCEFEWRSGEHYYDPKIGGDTESRVVFEARVGSESSLGDFDDWLSTPILLPSTAKSAWKIVQITS
jgi:hypothetical protein